MDSSVRINLLGPPELLVGNRPVGAGPYALALLGYFFLRDTKTITRQEIAVLLWPRTTQRDARHSLSQLTYSINRELGIAAIQGDRTRLFLQGVSADVKDFRNAVDAENWTNAAALFRGGLLQGTEFMKAPAFEELIEQFRLEFIDAALRTAEHLHLDGNPVLATRVLRHLPPHLSTAPQSWETIRAELDVTLPFGSFENSHPSLINNIPARFVGRKSEMEWLECVHQSAAGATVAVVEGEPGVGKTTLATRFGKLRALRGSRVCLAQAFDAERNVPYGIVAQWIKDLGDSALREVEPPWNGILNRAFGREDQDNSPLSMDGPVTSEFRLLEALRRLVLSISNALPLVLILDDAHRADPASLGFIHYFSRRSPDAPVFFLATTTTGRPNSAAPFALWEDVRRVRLNPLSLEEVSALVSSFDFTRGSDAEDTIPRLYQRTGGNPLLLLWILAEGRQPDDEVPASLVDFFLPRLISLSENASNLLTSIAIAGRSISLEAASEISQVQSPILLNSALRELENAGLVTFELDDHVRTRHGIIADVALRELIGPRRRSLYGRAARVLSDHGQSQPSVLAIKHDIGGDRTRAFETAQKAAAASRELFATREQEFFLKLALSNAPNPVAEANIRIELADLFRDLGRPSEGLDIVADDVIADVSESLRSRAKASRLTIKLRKVDISTNLVEVWSEIERLSDRLNPEVTADLYYHLAAAAHDLGRTGDAIAAAKRALDATHILPTSARTALIAARSAMVLGLYLGVDEGLSVIDPLLISLEADLEAMSQCLWARGTVLIAAGKLLEAEDALLHGIERMERCCLYGSLFGVHNNLGVCYMEQGRFVEARKQLQEATRVGRDFLGPSRAAIAADNMAMLDLEEGDHQSALDAYATVLPDTDRSSRALFQRHGIIGLCSLELGLLAQAFEAKREIELLFDQHEYWSNDVSYVEMFLARMLVLEDRVDEARERLRTGIEIYRARDVLCRARLELELARIDLKTEPGAALERAEAMLESLRGTGARPLIDRFEELADRARRHVPA